jgi:hypothetical protein
MKKNKFLDFVEDNQGFALGWLIPTLVWPTWPTQIIGLIFVILLIFNKFYQIKLKYQIQMTERRLK